MYISFFFSQFLITQITYILPYYLNHIFQLSSAKAYSMFFQLNNIRYGTINNLHDLNQVISMLHNFN